MVTKLGLHWSLNHVQIGAEDHLVELLDHLAGPELAQVSTGLTRRALRVCLRQIGEIRPTLNLCLQIVTFILCRNQNMPCTSACQIVPVLSMGFC